MSQLLLRIVLGAMLALATTGCSTRPVWTGVDYAMVLPPFAARTQLQQDEVFLMAAPIDSLLPLFPGDVDPRELAGAMRVCIELVVNEQARFHPSTPSALILRALTFRFTPGAASSGK